MKARIEKKLSGRLVEIAPSLFGDAWVDDDEPTALAQDQGSRVSNILSVGGGLDYWGEGTDWYTAWNYWQENFMWYSEWPDYPVDHELHGYPDLSGFRQTTKNLLMLAKEAQVAGCIRFI